MVTDLSCHEDVLSEIEKLYAKGAKEFVEEVSELIRSDLEDNIFISYFNSHTFYLYHRDPAFKNFFGMSRYKYVDGKGPEWLFKSLDLSKACKITSADYLGSLFSNLAGKKIFMWGYSSTQLARIEKYLRHQYPQVEWCGFQNGFHRGRENLVKLQKALPDLVILGMGSPLQETYLWDNREGLAKSVYLPVGAGLLYESNLVTRAPRILQNLGLEWLFRFFQSPLRLGPRYLISNTFLVYWGVLYWFKRLKNS